MDKYPRGFLTQLGEKLGKTVGLGKATDNTTSRLLEEQIRTIEAVVRTAEKQLGVIHIVYEGKGLVTMSYRGEHPLFPNGDGWVALAKYWGGFEPFSVYFAREDGNHQIDFPGGFINDRFFREVTPSGIDAAVYRKLGEDIQAGDYRQTLAFNATTAISRAISEIIDEPQRGMQRFDL